jgi:hypothetical protein
MPHRRIVAALFAAALLIPATAGAMGIEKGLKAGVNLSGFRGEFADLVRTQNKFGFVGGAFVAFGMAPDLAIQVEGLFSMKGAKATSTRRDESGNPLGEHHTFFNVNYLEVPVLLRGTLLRTSPVQPMYYLGPTVGLSLGGKMQSDLAGVRDLDLTNLRTVNFGLALGAGAGFELGGKKVLTEIRWTTGLSGIWDSGDSLESINDVFSFTAGVAF